jgi:Na+-translocating ferredoxin:NAD+ oxidoreductase RNF subunit RnfB
MSTDTYKKLADRLNSLPNGFPPTDSGIELKLLAKLFSREEAGLAAQLRLTRETPSQIVNRIDSDPKEIKKMLKTMVRKGLIRAGRTDHGLGYGLMPFVIGIYEYQIGSIDLELATLFEEYYQEAFSEALSIKPSFHRVIPVNETVRNDMEVHPFESASEIVSKANAWGLMDCICRVQKKLIGDPCDHPVDVCMAFHSRPGAFDGNDVIRSLTKEEAMSTLKRAADAGLVHSVSNTQEDTTYICNCCTCSCGILRGMAEMGISNVIARSAFVNQVDETLCAGCEICIDYCQFNALSLRPEDPFIQINQSRCTGCGVCVPACPDHALSLIRRPEEEISPILPTEDEWLHERAAARKIDITDIL